MRSQQDEIMEQLERLAKTADEQGEYELPIRKCRAAVDSNNLKHGTMMKRARYLFSAGFRGGGWSCSASWLLLYRELCL